jgi:predicted pyridoxine 5'-phosphate oxidase superfamily flavin-nucleotide-binding protein
MSAGVTAEGDAFHVGERELQDEVGLGARMATIGRRAIRDEMPDEHRDFFAQLPFVVVGGLDSDSWPWASVIVAPPGFMTSPDPRTLVVNAVPAPGAPLARDLRVGDDIGLLGIELETRRRNRLNGVVVGRSGDALAIGVKQSFGNCPQYIQRRLPGDDAPPVRAGTVEMEQPTLSEAAQRIVKRSDTLFIASATSALATPARASGVDVSHRGGKPGFVRQRSAAGGTELVFPDFRGNFFFNTLGNLRVFPRAGLLFIDFPTGDLLAVTGDAEVLSNGDELSAFAGAEHLVRLFVQRGVRVPRAFPLGYGAPSYAAQLGPTGSWPTTPPGGRDQ